MREEQKKKRVGCPIEAALKIVGDRWTLLIVRDVLRGVNRFETLQSSLKISRNVLTVRLNELEHSDLLYKSPIKAGAKRMLYKPTPKCLGLTPTLLSLAEWTGSWSNSESHEENVQHLGTV